MVRGGGGSYYDRDYYVSDNNNQQVQQQQQQQIQNQVVNSYSIQSAKVLNSKGVHQHLDPKIKVRNRIACMHRNPIVFALDVTGTMGDWTRIIYDKLPVFYGQIMQQGYLTDPAISVCAIGDHKTDDAPLQISEFQQGALIDGNVQKIWLEGAGGGNKNESYELAAFFYSRYCDLQNSESSFMFITGDEGYWKIITKKTIKEVFDLDIQEQQLNSNDIWNELQQKFHVFHLRKPYWDAKDEKIMKNQWIEGINEQNILMVEHPKACIDIMLGAIAIKSGTRDLNQYIQDMKDRGQDEERIQEVKQSLKHLTKIEIKNDQQYQHQLKKFDQQVQKIQQNQQQQQIKNVQDQLEEIKIDQNQQNLDIQAQKLIDKVRKHVMPIFQKDENIQKKKIIFKERMPEEFYCPITDEIFIEPVTADDGNTYEKTAILIWLKTSNISPQTGKQISNILTPNIGIQQLIESYQLLEQN